MQHLVVYAHPNPRSFSAAPRTQIATTLEQLGETVRQRDLYASAYRPSLSTGDFEQFFRGALPDDVREAQAEVAAADVLHLVYPLWWTGMPAALKGWVDRTFTPGFAYRRGPNGVEGLLRSKRAMLWTPHGNTAAEYEANGMYEALRLTVDVGVLGYVGIDVLLHRYFPDIRASNAETRTRWLTEVDARLVDAFGRPGRDVQAPLRTAA